jgi:hypothetical protein
MAILKRLNVRLVNIFKRVSDFFRSIGLVEKSSRQKAIDKIAKLNDRDVTCYFIDINNDHVRTYEELIQLRSSYERIQCENVALHVQLETSGRKVKNGDVDQYLNSLLDNPE